jgi:hypothetical protein
VNRHLFCVYLHVLRLMVLAILTPVGAAAARAPVPLVHFGAWPAATSHRCQCACLVQTLNRLLLPLVAMGGSLVLNVLCWAGVSAAGGACSATGNRVVACLQDFSLIATYRQWQIRARSPGILGAVCGKAAAPEAARLKVRQPSR